MVRTGKLNISSQVKLLLEEDTEDSTREQYESRRCDAGCRRKRDVWIRSVLPVCEILVLIVGPKCV